MNDRPPVRSFVRREGRITPAQQRALAELLPRYGIAFENRLLEPQAAFGRAAPLAMEIGFGNGEALCAMAAADPRHNYLGVEVWRPGVGRLLRCLAEAELDNVRVITEDAVVVLRQGLTKDSLDALYVFFPDPWPKKRHHKRRLVNPAFLDLAASRIRAGGRLHVATDWQDYADEVRELLAAHPGFREDVPVSPGRPAWRPATRYERRGEGLGHAVADLVYLRT
ncbi:MAG: tRNA (guanosine(46)-N7)-methyltransferase TrmB [Gammaproteobacteria bacterium]|jgi:tRNA (guanine-N7-)-methyltransferase|nr:tRNA (guanosine(46)-N7)-methyltransferase TrmB [Gammaproteobacteria bacterium]